MGTPPFGLLIIKICNLALVTPHFIFLLYYNINCDIIILKYYKKGENK